LAGFFNPVALITSTIVIEEVAEKGYVYNSPPSSMKRVKFSKSWSFISFELHLRVILF
jgi:hypothetical protein